MAVEVWKPVVGYEGIYEVSDAGRVKSFARPTSRILAGCTDKDGYRCVDLLGSTQLIHRLVCLAFHGPSPEGRPDVNHQDAGRQNNRLSNLEWASSRENTAHRHALGRSAKGEGNGWSTLTEDLIRQMRAAHDFFDLSYRKIGRTFNISATHAKRIVTREAWGHVH